MTTEEKLAAAIQTLRFIALEEPHRYWCAESKGGECDCHDRNEYDVAAETLSRLRAESE